MRSPATRCCCLQCVQIVQCLCKAMRIQCSDGGCGAVLEHEEWQPGNAVLVPTVGTGCAGGGDSEMLILCWCPWRVKKRAGA